ncbi:hypothetical protein JCM3765_006231 [Sporobolomyces pararoseus]
MQYEDAPSPPSRRHRRPPPPRPDRKSLPSRLKRIEQQKQAEAQKSLLEADKGKGKAKEDLEVVQEREEKIIQSTKQHQPPQTGPIASTSTVIETSPSSTLTPLERLAPAKSPQKEVKGPELSQIFPSRPPRTPYRSRTYLASSRSRKRRSNPSSDSETDYENPISEGGGSRKRPPVKKLKSARSSRKIWTAVERGFGPRKEKWSQEAEEASDSEGESSEESIERFRQEVLPLSTAIERQRRERGELTDEETEENAQEYELAEPRKPFKRISTFLGGKELDRMSKENKKQLLRKAPYRTATTDALPLEFVSPSEAGMGGTFDTTSNRRRVAQSDVEKEEKVKRLPPGRSPRTPFLETISQTEFAPLLDPEYSRRQLRRISDPFVSAGEAARISRKGSGWISTKRQVRPRRVGSKKKSLIMVRNEDAQDTARIDSDFGAKRKPNRINQALPRSRARPRYPKEKLKLRYVPARLPRPIRPFAQRSAPAGPRIEHQQTESIRGSSASRSAHPEQPAPPPDPSPFISKAQSTKFRFIVGPKAKKAPTVLVEDTPPTPAPPRQQQVQATFSAALPNPNATDLPQQDLEPKTNKPEAETKMIKRKQTLLRRLSTLPGHRYALEENKELDGVTGEDRVVVVEPSASLNRYNRSSHSNSQRSRLLSAPPPVPAPFEHPVSISPLVPLDVDLLPPAHQHSATLLPALRNLSIRPRLSSDNPSSSSFEQDAFEVLNQTGGTQSSDSLENPVNYLAILDAARQTNEQPSATATGGKAEVSWWMAGPTYSAALRDSQEEFDLAALRGEPSDARSSYGEGTMQSREENPVGEVTVGCPTSVVGPSTEEDGGEEEGFEEEQPPESILREHEG